MRDIDFTEFDADSLFLMRALQLADQAASEDEVPVGSVVVHGNRIIGSGYNQRESLNDPTAHAEMIAIYASGCDARQLASGRLYLVCHSGTVSDVRGRNRPSPVPRVVYGARDPKAGAVDSLFRLLDDPRLNHRASERVGVLADSMRNAVE